MPDGRPGRAEIEDRVLAYLRRELVDPDFTVARDTELLAGGVIDSIAVLRLATFVGQEFGIDIRPADFVIEDRGSGPGFISLVGIESPGLTSSLAIALWRRGMTRLPASTYSRATSSTFSAWVRFQESGQSRGCRPRFMICVPHAPSVRTGPFLIRFAMNSCMVPSSGRLLCHLRTLSLYCLELFDGKDFAT